MPAHEALPSLLSKGLSKAFCRPNQPVAAVSSHSFLSVGPQLDRGTELRGVTQYMRPFPCDGRRNVLFRTCGRFEIAGLWVGACGMPEHAHINLNAPEPVPPQHRS